MSVEITFTLDLEDHRPKGFQKRYPEITEKILDFLEKYNIVATVFVLGRVAEEEPDLIKTISDKGHEIGYHTFDHTHLYNETAADFRQKSDAGKKFLEDLTGQAVHGFRAPAFSLVKKSLWAVEIIKEIGFNYSSSILPVSNPINGFPGAPRQAFRWSNGLLEIPAAVTKIGPIEIPYLGGFYLRYLPLALIRKILKDSNDTQEKWLYCHPHDFDFGEPYYTIPGTTMITSLLLWCNRKHTFEKLESLFADKQVSASSTFIDQINTGKYDNTEVFNPLS